MGYSKKEGQIINHFGNGGCLTGFSVLVAENVVRHMSLNGKSLGFSERTESGGYRHFDSFAMPVEAEFDELFDKVYEAVSTQNSMQIPEEKKAIVFSGVFTNMNKYYRGYNGRSDDADLDDEESEEPCAKNSRCADNDNSGNSFQKCSSITEYGRFGSGDTNGSVDDYDAGYYDYRDEFPDGYVGDQEYENWLDDIND